MNHRGHRVVVIAVLLFAVAAFPQLARGAGVQPLVIDIEAQPGDTKEFELTITPGNAEELVDVSLYQPIQLLNGGLTYQEPDLESFPAAGWVKLSEQQVRVYPGSEAKIQGTVQVPFGAGGSHTVVLMVEPQTPSQQGGITFKVRYAVRLNIRVPRVGLRPSAELAEFNLAADEEGSPIIKARIVNPSAWDYLMSGEVTIRDANRRLVERVVLRAPAGMHANTDSTRIYPGSEVEFVGAVTKRLDPGDYNLRALFRYDEHGQIVQSKDVVVKPGDFIIDPNEMGTFSVTPAKITENLRAGQRKSMVLEVQSEIGEPSVMTVSGQDVEQQYKYSLLNWLELRSAPQFELAGRGKGRVILTVAVPRDTEDGSYHGNIVLQAFEPEEKELLSVHTVPVSILVGQDLKPSVEVRSLHVEKLEEASVVSLDVANIGRVAVSPSARITFLDLQGNPVESLTLTLSDETDEILPLKSRQLTGDVVNLPDGQYRVLIEIRSGNEVIYSYENELEIKDGVVVTDK